MSARATILFRDAGLFDGERDGGQKDVLIEGGIVAAIAPPGSLPSPDGATVDGGAVLPGLVDAHVHVSFSDPVAMARGGVTAALDLGEPIEVAFAAHPPLRLRASGPLLTAPGGYPTQSWGAGGYGWPVASGDEARAAVASLADRGAAMIKIALTAPPSLDAEAAGAIVAAAHAAGLRVAAHALQLADVRVAISAGVDALAHTPVERLPDDVVAALAARGTTIVSTVRAFGDGEATRANLEALAAAGCPVVYGTDLGNDGIAPGADPSELSILAAALGGRVAALRAATSLAAAFAGFPPARIRPGEPANIIATRDHSFASLTAPHRIVIDGKEFA